ncbi:MAG: hypothetical protein VXX85_01765, partial [Candidatus Margulisiibacteriota bacterium]|nr:hypothetical protein [Candidatus Margulisiibacteriota bacterium]
TVNSYEGTVSFNSISSLNNITSSYYYIDSILTEYSFRGNGQQIYSQENNDLKFQSWPIQYNGIDEIRMYNDEYDDGILLDPNSDYNIVYSNDGSQLTNITIIFTPTNPGGQLTEYPTTRDTLKVKYFFTPSGDETKSDSSHEMIDVRAKKRINKNWEIYTEIAKSKYNFSKTSKFNQETFQTAQENNKYLLAQSPIEENSELVFINGVSQTRGRDYYISYENGTVTLINKSITDGVTVEISYNYFLTDTPNINDVNAYVVESVFNPNDKIEIINKYNYVDPNFIPIGNININKGSSKIYNELNWQMSQNEYISFFYENEDIQNSDYNTMYTKDSYVTKLKFYSLVFDTEHEIRFDDIQSSQNFKETPKKIIEYKNDITYFDDNDQLTLNSAFSQQNESISNENQLNSFSAGSKLTYVNNFKNKYGIEKGFFSPFYGFKVDKTNSKTNNNYNQKTIESYGFSSNAQLNDHITNNTNFEKSIYNTSFINNESYLDEYYNYANHAFFSPYNWINTSFVINHDETISPIPGQEDKVEDRQSYNIIQLSNKAGLEYIKAPKLIQGLFSGSNTSAGYLKTKRRENNQLKNYNEDRVYGNFTRFTPFEGFNIPTIKYDAYQSSFSNRAETSYQKESYSTSDFYSIVSNFTYKPNINYLRHISYDGNIKQSNSSTIGDLELVSGTQNLTETTIYNDQKMIGVNITPPKIPLIITNINNLIIRLERNWLKKTDQNITDSFDSNGNLFDNINSINNSDINADKLKTSYRLFNYFNLSNNALNESSFFNRNQYTDSTGSLYKTKQNVDQAVGWNFFAIKNTEYLKYEVINQYQNSNINVFPDNITSNYDSYLNLEQREVSHESKLKISRLISISGKLDGQDFNQFIASKNIADETDYFRQIKGSTGITVTPLSGLNIGYDYSIKQLHSDDYNNVTGYQDVFSIIYNPIKYENFELQFKFTLDRNWGFGFNTIEQTQLLQTNNELTSIDIISRDDEVYLSSLNLNIKLPINNSEHLESVTLTGEGYLKKII